MTDWQPIATAPHSYTDREILVYGGDGFFIVEWDEHYKVWRCTSDGGALDGKVWCEATHWMPLPEPPK